MTKANGVILRIKILVVLVTECNGTVAADVVLKAENLSFVTLDDIERSCSRTEFARCLINRAGSKAVLSAGRIAIAKGVGVQSVRNIINPDGGGIIL